MVAITSSCFFSSAVVSFGRVTPEQKDEVEKFGTVFYSWEEFLLLVSLLDSSFFFFGLYLYVLLCIFAFGQT